MKLLRASLAASGRALRTDTRGVSAVEFALVGGPFLIILLFILALSFDLFQQEALDSALHIAVRQLQTGNAQNVTNGNAFVQTYVCPNVQGLLNCNNIYINVQNFGSTTTNFGGSDYYNITTGTVPTTGGALDLSSFGSTSFCNSNASTYILVTAIYVAPSILGNLVPGAFSIPYNGQNVNAIMSQVAAVTEAYPPTTSGGTTTPAAACTLQD